MIEIPKNCPACGSLLETVNEQLFCRNKACPAQLSKKLEHFCKVLGIKGLGPKTLEKLELSELFDIFYLTKEELSTALGSSVLASKIYSEIDKAKQSSLATVLESFSVPLLGSTASKKLATIVASIEEINNETCQKAGLGPTVTKNIMDWLESDYKYIKDSMPFVFTKETTISTGKTVCITGKLKSFKTKADAEAALKMRGFEPVSSVTKGTSYLVDETSANSSKRQLAEKYNIPIIDNLTNFLKDI